VGVTSAMSEEASFLNTVTHLAGEEGETNTASDAASDSDAGRVKRRKKARVRKGNDNVDLDNPVRREFYQ
jgi:hypothetical protein